MYALGIDTSSMTGGVALLKDNELVGELVLNIRTTHSERLLPALDRLLADANISVKDLGLVSVVTGPGSFTGLRIGVATAKGLSYALGIPAIGVTTLEAYGWQFKYFPGIVAALVDARRENVFWQAFKGGVPLNEPSYAALQDVLDYPFEEQSLFVGDGAVNYGDRICSQVPTTQNLLRPSAVADLAYARFLKGEQEDAFGLNPTYMRQTEAERKWQEKV